MSSFFEVYDCGRGIGKCRFSTFASYVICHTLLEPEPFCRSLQDQGKAAYFVADPAKGLVTYSHDDFVGHWMLTHLGGEECGVAMVAGGQPKGY